MLVDVYGRRLFGSNSIKPQGDLAVDWNEDITDGLRAVWLDHRQNLVTGKYATRNTGVVDLWDGVGKGSRFQNNGMDTGETYFSGSEDRTVLGFWDVTTLADETFFAQGSSVSFERWELLEASGALRLEIQGTGVTSSLSTPNSSSYMVGARMDGPTLGDTTLYVGDQSQLLVNATTLNTNTSQTFLIADSIASASRDITDARMRWAYVWNRALSDDEIKEVRLNHYLFIKNKYTRTRAYLYDTGGDITGPVLSTTSAVEGADGPTEADVTFTSDENCTYDIYISTNASETEATVASNSVESGSATASVAENVSEVRGVTPGTQSYAHVRAEDGSANVSVTSIALSSVTSAYGTNATLDGLTIETDSLLMLYGGEAGDVHDGGNNADHLDDASANFGITVNGLTGDILRNVADVSETLIRVNTSTSINDDAGAVGDITAGTENDFDNGDLFEVVVGLAGDKPASGDTIHVPDTITLSAGDGSYTCPFYCYDTSTAKYSRMYIITDTAAGAPDGVYDTSLSVKGVLTLTLQASSSAGGAGFDFDEPRRKKKKVKSIDDQMFASESNFDLDNIPNDGGFSIDEA